MCVQLTLNNTHSIRSYNDPHAEKNLLRATQVIQELLPFWTSRIRPGVLMRFVLLHIKYSM